MVEAFLRAEDSANRLGASLAALRAAMEEAADARIRAGDERLTLVPGRTLVAANLLLDGVHPGDEGHDALGAAIGLRSRRC